MVMRVSEFAWRRLLERRVLAHHCQIRCMIQGCEHGLDEESRLEPTNPYAAAKVRSHSTPVNQFAVNQGNVY